MTDPRWLEWARELQALAQIGLTYCGENHYDRDRYTRIRAIAAEIYAEHGGLPPAAVEEIFARETGYATPKVDVRGVVFRDGKLLLVHEKTDGRWTLPGGWADVNETARGVAQREVWEESGVAVRPSKLLAVYDRSTHGHEPRFPHTVWKLFVQCDDLGGEPHGSDETLAAAFFAEDEIPELSASRVTPQQIARMFEHLRHPDLPTDFD